MARAHRLCFEEQAEHVDHARADALPSAAGVDSEGEGVEHEAARLARVWAWLPIWAWARDVLRLRGEGRLRLRLRRGC